MRRFFFRLAFKFGMPVRQLLSQIDSRELSEWVAFLNLEYAADTPEEQHQQTQEEMKNLLFAMAGKKDE
jgi:hypothetical protein